MIRHRLIAYDHAALSAMTALQLEAMTEQISKLRSEMMDRISKMTNNPWE